MTSALLSAIGSGSKRKLWEETERQLIWIEQCGYEKRYSKELSELVQETLPLLLSTSRGQSINSFLCLILPCRGYNIMKHSQFKQNYSAVDICSLKKEDMFADSKPYLIHSIKPVITDNGILKDEKNRRYLKIGEIASWITAYPPKNSTTFMSPFVSPLDNLNNQKFIGINVEPDKKTFKFNFFSTIEQGNLLSCSRTIIS